MAKVKPYLLSQDEKNKLLEDLYTMIAALKSREEVKNFLKDLLTPSESLMLARRIQVAKMLLDGKTHEEIKTELKVGLDTINRVQYWLHSGFGGYLKALKKLEKIKEEKEMEWRRRYPRSGFESIRRKYPLHFLLINAILDSRQNKEKKAK